jgi:hypothetical protein
MHELNGTPIADAQGSTALNEELFEAASIPISTNSAPVPATTEQKQTLSPAAELAVRTNPRCASRHRRNRGRAALVLFRELSADGALTGCPFA